MTSISDKQKNMIHGIVKQHTGLDALSIDILNGPGMSNQVFLVSTSDRQLVVRMNTKNHLNKYNKEAWCLEQADIVGIPVPKVVFTGVCKESSYSIANYIKNSVTIDESHCERQIWNRLGSYASKLNSVRANSFKLDVEVHRYFDVEADFKDVWRNLIKEDLALVFEAKYWKENNIFSKSELTKLRAVLEQCYEINSPLGLSQIDLCPANAVH